ncbi:4-(cytidine 5'-diphospho)-2-C-methyl-D-erythritol kinase [Chitinolyticbacter meiyuanensis]|uniref:4-(cytidine 5'-diphospho)-2-C-methyl-D-erythritol kinase n=1 Tax=Chitinolyticbacter meiyuanensis TaxID=682798 RepID=UPI0011E588D7|nr:4-(cytidine 5'-diphospho)-2-C-methyl-D-erythritol kinase [Chitinolyticbacter meiyuanensis]
MTISFPWQAYPAPAKLNLFLHIVGRRDDGYHLLQSVFQLIDIADTIHLRVRDDGEIHHHNPIPGVPADTDLTVRAARLLQQETGCRLGADIRVDKRLPMGGGIGGGSSDAATVLLALNRLWALNLDRSRLMQLGVQLGADVPFFIFGRNAFVEGIGEVMTPVETPRGWYVVLHPGIHVPTPAIFKSTALRRDCPTVSVHGIDYAKTENVMESVACSLFPQVAAARDWLGQYAPARMTGSGACVFAFFASQTESSYVLSRSPDELTGFNAKTLDQHPLYEYAD